MSISRRSILKKIPIALASVNVLKAINSFEKVESIKKSQSRSLALMF
ncbi:hypothetical protein E5L48_04980 [Helicobacter pylori]|nr:hypothetical protein E5L48_04980 [Helicobacter pylori]